MQKNLGIKIRPTRKDDPAYQAILATIEKQWKQVFSNAPLMYSFLEESVDAAYDQEHKLSGLIKIGMGITLLICCLGITGLFVFITGQRRKERGVRKVLGATVSTLIVLLSKDMVRLVALAMLIASPLAGYGLDQWLHGFACRISMHWRMLGLAGLVALLLALVSISFQTLKAARTNPVDSLRND